MQRQEDLVTGSIVYDVTLVPGGKSRTGAALFTFFAVALGIAAVVVVVVVIGLYRKRAFDEAVGARGCRTNAQCGDTQICTIDESGTGACVESNCKTKEDRDKCGGYCAYKTSDGALICSCDKLNYSTSACKQCTTEQQAAYVAAGGAPTDAGISSFVFCRPTGPESAPVLSWAKNPGDPTDKIPIFNSASPTVPAAYCVSSLTDKNFKVSACAQNQYCSQGECVDIGKKGKGHGLVAYYRTLNQTTKITSTVSALVATIVVVGVIIWLSTARKRTFADGSSVASGESIGPNDMW